MPLYIFGQTSGPGVLTGSFGGSGSGGELVKISSDDTDARFLQQKLIAGTNIGLTVQNEAGDETLTVSGTYVANVLDDWNGNTSPTNIGSALDQLADRVDTLEASAGLSVDASDVTYTPVNLSDWSNFNPGNVDGALDTLSARVTAEEARIYDATEITYSASTLADWENNTDPGDVDTALDQLASRVTAVEGVTVNVGAADVTYTPTVVSNWGGVDPGNVDDALDYLANQFNFVDAANVLYSPGTVTNWNGSNDPGNTDDALNQLASRVAFIENNNTPGTVLVSAGDTQADFLNQKIISGTAISFATQDNSGNKTLVVNFSGQASDVPYTPAANANWNDVQDPGNTDDALNQLASRVQTIEDTVTTPTAATVDYTPAVLANWNSNADPGFVRDALDQLANRTLLNDNARARISISANDTTPDYLIGKLSAGTNIVIAETNDGSNESITVSAQPFPASDVPYIPSNVANWQGSDPGDTNDALNQLAERLTPIESSFPLNAATIPYTPNSVNNWDGNSDPGDIDDALNQLASRLSTIEAAAVDASVVSYTPALLTNWNSNTDPGDVDEALDQIAVRLSTLETNTASDLAYTPTTLTDWNSDSDPGNTNNALDQLADRLTNLESGTGATPDAAGVTYTPATLTDWNSDSDPGNTNNALDQLADRVDTLEIVGSAGGQTSFLAQETIIEEAFVVPPGHQTSFINGFSVGVNGSLQIDGEVFVSDYNKAYEIEYSVSDVSDWNSTPLRINGALDELANRVSAIEVGAIAVNYTPAVSADWSVVPTNVKEALDSLAENQVEIVGWKWDPFIPATNASSIWNNEFAFTGNPIDFDEVALTSSVSEFNLAINNDSTGGDATIDISNERGRGMRIAFNGGEKYAYLRKEIDPADKDFVVESFVSLRANESTPNVIQFAGVAAGWSGAAEAMAVIQMDSISTTDQTNYKLILGRPATSTNATTFDLPYSIVVEASIDNSDIAATGGVFIRLALKKETVTGDFFAEAYFSLDGEKWALVGNFINDDPSFFGANEDIRNCGLVIGSENDTGSAFNTVTYYADYKFLRIYLQDGSQRLSNHENMIQLRSEGRLVPQLSIIGV